MLDGCLCQKAGGCSIFKKDIFREKLLSFFFLFSTKRKKENQIVWINLFTLRLLWKETRSCQNLTKCFGWVLLFGVFFSTPQNYAVPSGVHCFAGMYQFQWKGFCMAHFCHLWSIFVTSERRCQIKKKKNLSNLKTDAFTQFHLWCRYEGFGSVPAQCRNTWQNELFIVQKVQLGNHRSVSAWHLCGWAST